MPVADGKCRADNPLQTSDSLRVGEVQVGPQARSMAAVLNKELGLSYERTARC